MSALARIALAGVSVGLTLSLTSCGEEVVVPDVVGMRLDTAEDTLKRAGFEHADAVDVVGDSTPFRKNTWAVLEQDPPAGSPAQPDDEVQLGAGPLDKPQTKERLPKGSPALAQIAAEGEERKRGADQARPAEAQAARAPTPTRPLQVAEPKGNEPAVECQNRPSGDEIFVRYLTTDEPPTAIRLGGGWVWDFGENECISTVEMALRSNPPLPGFCTQVALVSSEPRYDPNARPAPYCATCSTRGATADLLPCERAARAADGEGGGSGSRDTRSLSTAHAREAPASARCQRPSTPSP